MGIDNLSSDSGEVSSSNQKGLEKAGRVVRMVRLVRLVRLYKIASNRRKEREIADELDVLVDQGVISDEERFQKGQLHATRQSKVGAELSDTITRRVILIILLMLCFVPFLSYSQTNTIEAYAARGLHEFNLEGERVFVGDYMEVVEGWVGENEDGSDYLIYAEAIPTYSSSTPITQNSHLLNTLRPAEYISYSHSSEVDGVSYETKLQFNHRYFIRDIALKSLLLTLFVSIMLLLGAMRFTADAQELVLAPIERMMNMVDVLASDPLKEVHFENKDSDEGDGEYETKLLENTLEKLTGLLRVGFGEAGASIIAENLNLTDSSTDTLIDPLIAGKRIYAIFGFCDIHHFQDITVTLQGEVMAFVNTVAEVVHGMAERYGGQSNKNLGNAFLMVWRIGDKEMVESVNDMGLGGRGSPGRRSLASTSGGLHRPSFANIQQSPQTVARKSSRAAVDLRRLPGVDKLADQSLISFLKVIVKINSDPNILAFRSNSMLCDAFGGEYKLRMGFGLHAGWAIEGAVGSLHKVDATYLSPHVNMCARMESASRQYGVPLLMTEDFVQLLSSEGLKTVRKLDVVTVKGSEVPVGVFTYDTYQEQDFHHVKENYLPGFSTYSPDIWRTDSELLALKSHLSDEFLVAFKEGVKNYVNGNWEKSREVLEQCHQDMADYGGDGPSCTLLSYMASFDFIPPPGWEGFRPLTNK